MLKSNSFQDIRIVNVLHKNIFRKDTRSFYLNMQELKYHKKIPLICLLEGLKELYALFSVSKCSSHVHQC